MFIAQSYPFVSTTTIDANEAFSLISKISNQFMQEATATCIRNHFELGHFDVNEITPVLNTHFLDGQLWMVVGVVIVAHVHGEKIEDARELYEGYRNQLYPLISEMEEHKYA